MVMAEKLSPACEYTNAILKHLTPQTIESIRPQLHPVALAIRQNIYRPNEPMQFAYFVESGMISIVSLMGDGRSIEVGTIGREGMAGASLLVGMDSVPYHYFVQIAGHGHRMDASALKAAAYHNEELRNLILRYQATSYNQSMQAIACNGLHSVPERCCRWLLMSHDRMQSNKVSLTHEFLALMLGVRRASVSEVLGPLQEKGWVQSNRGEITILDRTGLEAGSCECYGIIAGQQKYLLS
jgi:CRP-like cAMP-binding protein